LSNGEGANKGGRNLIFDKEMENKEMKMAKKVKIESCQATMDRSASCCKVESLISIDERGQMILPKEIRDKAKIRPGDKLALVSWEKAGKICCISLIKAEDFAEMVKGLLSPMMKEIIAR